MFDEDVRNRRNLATNAKNRLVCCATHLPQLSRAMKEIEELYINSMDKFINSYKRRTQKTKAKTSVKNGMNSESKIMLEDNKTKMNETSIKTANTNPTIGSISLTGPAGSTLDAISAFVSSDPNRTIKITVELQ